MLFVDHWVLFVFCCVRFGVGCLCGDVCCLLFIALSVYGVLLRRVAWYVGLMCDGCCLVRVAWRLVITLCCLALNV